MNKHIDISNIVLSTNRLTLRPWRESDLNDFYEYASVDGVGQMAGWNPHRSIEESKTILSHFISGKHVFALEYQGKVIGSLGIEEYEIMAFLDNKTSKICKSMDGEVVNIKEAIAGKSLPPFH